MNSPSQIHLTVLPVLQHILYRILLSRVAPQDHTRFDRFRRQHGRVFDGARMASTTCGDHAAECMSRLRHASSGD